jgi:PAS domain S-box-containing protein
MLIAPLHPQEKDRLQAIRSLHILIDQPEAKFDEVTFIAAHVCQTPMALLSIVDEDTVCFKSKIGLDTKSTPRQITFCAHAILETAPFIITDATKDPRFHDSPLVTEAPHIRFYAGVPVISPDGQPIGTICVIDTKPREIEQEKIQILQTLSGQITRLLELNNKIDELEKTQGIIKKQEKESRAILDGVPSLVGHWDTDVCLINSNAVYQSFFGSLENTKGQHARVVLGEDLYQKNIPHINKALQGEEVHFQREITKQDGSVAHAMISFVPNFINGKVASFFSISTDITEVKKAEEARRELESKLINSDRLSVLGEIACGVAHEINSPLAIIFGKLIILKLQLEKLGNVPVELIESITKIESTGERIAKIVKGLQTYSRKADSDPMISTPLHSIISDSLVLCEDRLKHASVKLTTNCPSDVSILCHPAQISQVLINLVMNSIDAITNFAEKWITIDVTQTTEDVKIIITDCGPGIPAEIAAKLMEAFFTTKEVGKGTGLGLSISKSIIEAHGGSLVIDSEAAHTTFVIALKK